LSAPTKKASFPTDSLADTCCNLRIMRVLVQWTKLIWCGASLGPNRQQYNNSSAKPKFWDEV
jgi:hypothetical protein